MECTSTWSAVCPGWHSHPPILFWPCHFIPSMGPGPLRFFGWPQLTAFADPEATRRPQAREPTEPAGLHGQRWSQDLGSERRRRRVRWLRPVPDRCRCRLRLATERGLQAARLCSRRVQRQRFSRPENSVWRLGTIGHQRLAGHPEPHSL